MFDPQELTDTFSKQETANQTSSGCFRTMALTKEDYPVFNEASRCWERYKDLALAAAQAANYSQAEAMWLAALSEAQQFEPLDRRLVYTLENLAAFYFALGKYDQAESFCLRSVNSIGLLYGINHIRVAPCLNSLAGIYYNQGRFVEAEPLCVRLLEIYEKYCHPNHPDVGVAANNLAMLYHSQGRYKAAEKLYRRALVIRRQALGGNHPQVQTLMLNYANLIQELNECEQRATVAKLPSLRMAV